MAELPFVTRPGDHSYVFVGPFPQGSVITVTWTGATVTTPCGQYGYACQLNRDGVGVLYQTHPSGSEPGSFVYTTPGPVSQFEFDAFTDSYCSGGTLHGATFSSTGGVGYCQYGTERNPTAEVVLYVTRAVLLAAATPFGWVWTVAALAGFEFSTINLDLLCADPPPAPPPATLDLLNASMEVKLEALKFVLWYSYCQCKPGSPAPVPYPPPVLTEPVGWPTAPTFDCDNLDVCATLLQIQQTIAQLSQTVGGMAALTSLIQRYGFPFAAIRGAAHSGLKGGGAFSVPRIVGAAIEITELLGEHKLLEGVPPYVWDLGWIALGTVDGMFAQQRLTRMNQEWLPEDAQIATTLSFFLKAGVTARITELYAEP